MSLWRNAHHIPWAILIGTRPHVEELRRSAGPQPGSEWFSLLAQGHKQGISVFGPMVPSFHHGSPEDRPTSHSVHRQPSLTILWTMG